MKYLERCLMETLRMYPPVPIIARQLKEDLKLGKPDAASTLKLISDQTRSCFQFLGTTSYRLEQLSLLLLTNFTVWSTSTPTQTHSTPTTSSPNDKRTVITTHLFHSQLVREVVWVSALNLSSMTTYSQFNLPFLV